jgi:tetratricopeptide (TPR) repeat protein
MSEEIERSGEQVGDPVAVSLALAGASRAKADAFLDEQRHHLKNQFRLRQWELRLAVLLRFATAFTGLAIAAAISFLVWDASRADGLVIEAFSVPPDLAAKGITGQVVASLMLDKLTAMQNATGSLRPAKSYANNWGNDLKVEIPETGISLGEAYRFLRGWLGHETRISGEVYRIDQDIAMNVRVSGEPGAAVTGPESDLDGLVQNVSEKVYGNTQPYRYANYLYHYAPMLGAALRPDEAETILKRLSGDANPLERAWAWEGLGQIYAGFKEDDMAAAAASRNAVAAYPDLPLAHLNLAGADESLGRSEAALAEYKVAQRLLNRASVPEMRSDLLPSLRASAEAVVAYRLGDYAQAVRLTKIVLETPSNRDQDGARRAVATALASQHDGAAARTYFSEMPPPPVLQDRGLRAVAQLQIDYELENWRAVMASEESVEKSFAQFNKGSDFNVHIGNGPRLWLALAKARTGDVTGAQSLVAATHGDCYDCVRTRGLVAAAGRQWARADYWFAKTVHDAPSIPFAYADWGQSWLDRGKPDEAIAQFTIANRCGPHFADPLEGWGEALMAKNQSHLALAKFAEAEKYAANWGRLHLKWGEALYYTGRKDEAGKQFARAAQLDLTPSEKSELARMTAHD